MVKNIIKEIIIILLMTLAIILILGVILYDYVPANKIVPEEVSYSPPEALEQELNDNTNDMTSGDLPTYTITDNELSNYKKIQEYVPGKKNPFASIATNDTSNTTGNDVNGTTTETQSNKNTTIGTDTTMSNGSSSTTDNNKNTGYIPDKGTK